MNRTIRKFAVASLMSLLVGACGSKTVTEYHEGSRDNVIDGTSLMVSLDEKLPPIHSFAVPVMAGDTLVILDYRSADLICTAYDIYNDSTIGKFGKFGAGPGEIGNPLLIFYNQYNKNLYIGSGIREKILSLYLPDAVSDSTYNAVDGPPTDIYRGILYPTVLDESTVLCTTWSNLNARDTRISKLNIDTGEITVIDTVASGEYIQAGIAVSEKDDLIFSVDRQHDMIRLYNLEGKLQSIIYGPEYDENVEEDDYFFSVSEICGDQVASTYTGRNLEPERSIIIFTDLDGKYLKTLRFDDTVHGMAYHDKTGRLYLTTKGEPQIGYIELDKIQD